MSWSASRGGPLSHGSRDPLEPLRDHTDPFGRVPLDDAAQPRHRRLTSRQRSPLHLPGTLASGDVPIDIPSRGLRKGFAPRSPVGSLHARPSVSPAAAAATETLFKTISLPALPNGYEPKWSPASLTRTLDVAKRVEFVRGAAAAIPQEATPSSREDVMALARTIDRLLRDLRRPPEQGDASALASRRLFAEKRLYEMGLGELVRQVGLHCAERGWLFDQLWTSYQTLVNASIPKNFEELRQRAEKLGVMLEQAVSTRRALERKCAELTAERLSLLADTRVMRGALRESEHEWAREAAAVRGQTRLAEDAMDELRNARGRLGGLGEEVSVTREQKEGAFEQLLRLRAEHTEACALSVSAEAGHAEAARQLAARSQEAERLARRVAELEQTGADALAQLKQAAERADAHGRELGEAADRIRELEQKAGETEIEMLRAHEEPAAEEPAAEEPAAEEPAAEEPAPEPAQEEPAAAAAAPVEDAAAVALKADVQKLEATRDQLSRERNSLRARCEATQSEHTRSAARASALQEHNEELQNDLTSAREMVEELEEKLRKAGEKAAADALEAKQQAKAAEEANTGLQQQVQTAELKAHDMLREMETLRRQLAAVQDELEEIAEKEDEASTAAAAEAARIGKHRHSFMSFAKAGFLKPASDGPAGFQMSKGPAPHVEPPIPLASQREEQEEEEEEEEEPEPEPEPEPEAAEPPPAAAPDAAAPAEAEAEPESITAETSASLKIEMIDAFTQFSRPASRPTTRDGAAEAEEAAGAEAEAESGASSPALEQAPSEDSGEDSGEDVDEEGAGEGDDTSSFKSHHSRGVGGGGVGGGAGGGGVGGGAGGGSGGGGGLSGTAAPARRTRLGSRPLSPSERGDGRPENDVPFGGGGSLSRRSSRSSLFGGTDEESRPGTGTGTGTGTGSMSARGLGGAGGSRPRSQSCGLTAEQILKSRPGSRSGQPSLGGSAGWGFGSGSAQQLEAMRSEGARLKGVAKQLRAEQQELRGTIDAEIAGLGSLLASHLKELLPVLDWPPELLQMVAPKPKPKQRLRMVGKTVGALAALQGRVSGSSTTQPAAVALRAFGGGMGGLNR